MHIKLCVKSLNVSSFAHSQQQFTVSLVVTPNNLSFSFIIKIIKEKSNRHNQISLKRSHLNEPVLLWPRGVSQTNAKSKL